ncbi:MAG: SsrA-binding protein SmpB [Alphaproteobacteria bacterium]|nr:SsrA-binding protein SmpB [Alphaproteobacteria bacterium]
MARQIIKSGQVAENRKARFEYAVEDTIEAGISLTGAEVKSVRYGLVNISDAFVQTSGATARRGLTAGSDINLVLSNMVIQALPTANKAVPFNERRYRQLLLHRNQINRLAGKLNEKGATIVPLKIYFNARGRLKVLLGVGFGKSKIDKRETIKKREWEKDKARVLKRG